MSASLVPIPRVESLVLDSWPVVEWLKMREPARTGFFSRLEQAKAGTLRLRMSTINLGEVYYLTISRLGQVEADRVLQQLMAMPIELLHPSRADALLAARVKGTYHCSYPDSFAAVLALQLEASVLTGDPDFLRLERSGLVAVEWIGA